MIEKREENNRQKIRGGHFYVVCCKTGKNVPCNSQYTKSGTGYDFQFNLSTKQKSINQKILMKKERGKKRPMKKKKRKKI